MDWEVFYYQSERGESPIEEFLNGLSLKARAKCLAYIEQLEQFGNRLPSNFASKVQGDVWELRPEWSGVEHRFFYFTFVGQRIVIVHALTKKSQKLKAQDIAVALARVEEVRAREKATEEAREKAAQKAKTFPDGTPKTNDEPQITPAIRPRTK